LVQPAPAEATALRSVGQMVALANPSGELTHKSLSWVELDPSVSKALGLGLEGLAKATVGEAFGTTIIPSSYIKQIIPGQKLDILRYGLRKNSTRGFVVSIKAAPKEPDSLLVVFAIKNGENWYPGTNCEIEFPLVKSKPLKISKSALLHEGLQEYVFKWVTKDKLGIRRVTVVGETESDVFVLDGDLAVGNTIVGEGAILLKPVLHKLLSQKEGIPHAL
jgi:hypothetical protein